MQTSSNNWDDLTIPAFLLAANRPKNAPRAAYVPRTPAASIRDELAERRKELEKGWGYELPLSIDAAGLDYVEREIYRRRLARNSKTEA